MEVTKENFREKASKLGFSEEQINALWKDLEKEPQHSKDTNFSNLLYYFGAMIVISAMTWLMSIGWQWFGGGAVFLISFCYAFFFSMLGIWLSKQEDLKIPGGLLITMAVCMTPLAIWGLETHFGFLTEGGSEKYRDYFHLVKSSWIFMELGTIVACLIALRFFPFPFLTAPLFFSLWFLSMDIVPLIGLQNANWRIHEWISLLFGIATLLSAFWIDKIKKPEFAFWAYFFGTFLFWASLTSLMYDKGEVIYAFYLMINLAMMVLSVLLKRKVLLVYGTAGTFLYLSHLAYEIFQNSIWFPFALSAIGLLVIFLGIKYQRNADRIEKWLYEALPSSIQRYI